MKKTTLILLFCALAACAFALDADVASSFDDHASFAGKYLNINAGAAGAAMGDAYSCAVSDASAVFWNPSALTGLNSKDAEWNLFISHNLWLADMMLDYVAVAKNFKKAGIFGIGITYFNAGVMEKYNLDANGQAVENGSLAPFALVASLSYANTLEKNLSYGATFKYVLDAIDGNNAQAFIFDAGLKYSAPIEGLAAAVVFKNFGTTLNKENISKEVILGTSYTADISGFKTTAAYEWAGQVSNIPVHRVGLEIKTPAIINLRAGFHTDNTKVEGLRNVTFGTGFNIDGKYMDLSFAPFGDIGNSFQLSMGGSF